VLLSFAQFEREVIGERVRDKIAASKRKGLWVGGPIPLGCYSACKIDPPYCLICECYPGGAVGADGPARTDLLSLSTSKACSKGGAVGGSGHA
jgi:hypothetical protein